MWWDLKLSIELQFGLPCKKLQLGLPRKNCNLMLPRKNCNQGLPNLREKFPIAKIISLEMQVPLVGQGEMEKVPLGSLMWESISVNNSVSTYFASQVGNGKSTPG